MRGFLPAREKHIDAGLFVRKNKDNGRASQLMPLIKKDERDDL